MMDEIKVEKVTLNIGTGEPRDRLDKATKLLKTLTNEKPIQTKTKKRIPTWNLRPGLVIGCKVTLRKDKAAEMLRRLLKAANNQLKKSKFDSSGNFSFGIEEHLDIPGVKYDATIGIIGLGVAVTLSKPGYRIKKRRLKNRGITHAKSISKQEAMDFVKEKFNVEVA